MAASNLKVFMFVMVILLAIFRIEGLTIDKPGRNELFSSVPVEHEESKTVIGTPTGNQTTDNDYVEFNQFDDLDNTSEYGDHVNVIRLNYKEPLEQEMQELEGFLEQLKQDESSKENEELLEQPKLDESSKEIEEYDEDDDSWWSW